MSPFTTDYIVAEFQPWRVNANVQTLLA
jgi:hypothetical protein